MIIAVYSLACLSFYIVFLKLDLVPRTITILHDFRAVSAVMSDVTLNDNQKEKLIRQAAISALRQTIDLFLRLAAILIFAFLPILVARSFLDLSIAEITAFSLRPTIIIGTIFILAGVEWIRRRMAN